MRKRRNIVDSSFYLLTCCLFSFDWGVSTPCCPEICARLLALLDKVCPKPPAGLSPLPRAGSNNQKNHPRAVSLCSCLRPPSDPTFRLLFGFSLSLFPDALRRTVTMDDRLISKKSPVYPVANMMANEVLTPSDLPHPMSRTVSMTEFRGPSLDVGYKYVLLPINAMLFFALSPHSFFLFQYLAHVRSTMGGSITFVVYTASSAGTMW